jgi:hypothetical protein
MTTKSRVAVERSGDVVAEGPHRPFDLRQRLALVKGWSELSADARGAVFVEYLTLLCVVILGGSAAVVSLGQPLVHYYRVAQLVLGLPFP